MNALGEEFRAEVARHVGKIAQALVPRQFAGDTRARLSYGTLLDLFGSDNGILDAIGLGRPEGRAMTAQERRARRSGQEALRKYRTGQRNPREVRPDMAAAAHREQRARARPRSRTAVLRTMRREGVTSTLVEVFIRYQSPKEPLRPPRTITRPIYIAPSDFVEAAEWSRNIAAPRTDEGWEQLGADYLAAFFLAYGMPEEIAETYDPDDEDLDIRFELGDTAGQGALRSFDVAAFAQRRRGPR